MRRILLAACFVFATACGGLWVFAAWHDRTTTLAAAEQATAAMAMLLEQASARAIESGDATLQALAGRVSEWDLADRARGGEIQRQTVRELAATPQIASVWVIDAQGNNLLENWGYPARVGNFAHRDYFAAHVAGENGLYIGGTGTGTVTGLSRFTLSRAVRDGAGRLRAVVVAGIYSDHFRTLYEEMGRKIPMAVSLLSADGMVLARWPQEFVASDGGAPLAALGKGATATARLGDSMVSMRRAASLPIAVTARVELDRVLEPWRRRVLMSGLPTAGALVGFSVLMTVGLRAARRETAARLALARANDALDARVRQRTAELEQALARAEAANAAKDKFLATISHDLRQPLQGLAMFTTLAVQRSQDDQVRRLGEMTRASLQAGRRLLDELVELSHLEAGVAPVRIEEFAIEPLLRRIAADAQSAASAKGLRLRVVCCGTHIRSDPLRLQQIVQNLLGNAVKYTDRGGILLGCRRRGGALAIQVWDSGRGIADRHLSLIFDEFYQVANPARNVGLGAGLGLAIVRRVADLLRHPLTVRSVPGRGSVFTLTVPLARPSAEHEGEQRRRREAQHRQPGDQDDAPYRGGDHAIAAGRPPPAHSAGDDADQHEKRDGALVENDGPGRPGGTGKQGGGRRGNGSEDMADHGAVPRAVTRPA